MAKVILSTDSTCDLSKEIIEKYDIKSIPLIIMLDKEYRDGMDVSPTLIYDYVEEHGVLPKTAAVSSETFKEHFLNLTRNGDKVLHISISNRLSACYQNAKIAAQAMENVHIVDGYALSTGTSLLILKAHDLLNLGKSLEETVKELEVLKLRTQTSFVIDRLDYLYKGGRCSGLALLGSNLLKIHPMTLMQGGYLKSFKKFHGSMRVVYNSYIDYLAENFNDYDNTRAFITHTETDPAMLDMIKEKVKEKFNFKEVFDTLAGSTITCHCGKGTVGLLYITNNNMPV